MYGMKPSTIEDTLFDGMNSLSRRRRLLGSVVFSSLRHLNNLSLDWTTSRVVLFNMEKSLRDSLQKELGESHFENVEAAPAFDDNETKAILRKVDWRLLPMLTLLYVLSFIDRSNIGNAKVAGMNDDLSLTGTQYNVALTVFFFPYAFLEIPSNMLLKIIRPSLCIGVMMLAWGTVMTLMGIVQSFSGLAGARAALGTTEAGFFPVSTYLLTIWYRRLELQSRMAVFYSAASLAGAFSGLLAFAIQKMDTIGGWLAGVGSSLLKGNTIPIYGFTYTAPSVILGLRYSAANARLLTIPIYALGAIGTPVIAIFADKHKTRWPFIVGPYCISAIGFLGLLSIPHPALPGLTYAFLFCIPVGVYPPLIGLVSWIGNNLAPSWKRAVGMAFLIMMGNLGGAIGSNIYLEKQRPNFWLGFGFGSGFSIAAILATIILKFEYERLNQTKGAIGTEDEIRGRYSYDELLQMGDKSPLFRYIV
ncbi:hypothetical protein PENSTE_c001G00994 [Penicillium steckii]|uniref:Major facilitator superfamily (MFS) profile domain-containing protein n=1 Tax=Penicillium steckii TaxID=303698 RepID=A0A1V6TZ53_9EURO|nr:hypothetical protein PENSTE_c001G00994 [Penicillium steckii]